MTIPTNAYSKSQKNKNAFTLSIMSYNVENLFDAKDDAGKNDHAYLPLSLKRSESHIEFCSSVSKRAWRDECFFLDWHETAVLHKIKALKKVILGASKDTPDILVLAEVENEAVLEQLQVALGVDHYPYRVIIEGDDKRGIDVAMLSRYPLVGKATLHPIDFISPSNRRRENTRGILEARFDLPNKQEVVVYANHFPSPSNASWMRDQAFKKLNQLMLRYPKSQLQVAAGDFNVTENENKNGRFLKKVLDNRWQVAHEVMCTGVCKGTYYYPPTKSWSFLDMILLSGEFDAKNWQVSSVEIIQNQVHQLSSKGYPVPFDYKRGQGASDHLPIFLVLTRASAF